MPRLRAETLKQHQRGERGADHPLLDQPPGVLQAGAEEGVRRAADAYARGIRRLQQSLSAGPVHGQRLLVPDMLARADRLAGDLGVGVRGGQVDHEVDVVVGQQRVHGAEPAYAELFGLGPAASGIRSATATTVVSGNEVRFSRYVSLIMPAPTMPTPNGPERLSPNPTD